jgi:hypothetical protein
MNRPPTGLFSLGASARRSGIGADEQRRRATVVAAICAELDRQAFAAALGDLAAHRLWLVEDDRNHPRVIARLASAVIDYERQHQASWQPQRSDVVAELSQAFIADQLGQEWHCLGMITGLLLSSTPGPLSVQMTARISREFAAGRDQTCWQLLRLRRQHPQAALLGVALSRVVQLLLQRDHLNARLKAIEVLLPSSVSSARVSYAAGQSLRQAIDQSDDSNDYYPAVHTAMINKLTDDIITSLQSLSAAEQQTLLGDNHRLTARGLEQVIAAGLAELDSEPMLASWHGVH